MLKYDIAQLKASRMGRPEGYAKFILQNGQIDGGFVFVSDEIENRLPVLFPNARFSIEQLKADEKLLPEGFAEFIYKHGKINIEHVELELAALDELHERFPVPNLKALHQEPTLAEMTTNLTQAVADWARAGFKVVTKERFEERHAICKACEFWIPDARLGTGKCRKCGCSIYKLWMAASKCPLTPPKW
jgi:hypothetical protein